MRFCHIIVLHLSFGLNKPEIDLKSERERSSTITSSSFSKQCTVNDKLAEEPDDQSPCYLSLLWLKYDASRIKLVSLSLYVRRSVGCVVMVFRGHSCLTLLRCLLLLFLTNICAFVVVSVISLSLFVYNLQSNHNEEHRQHGT